MAFKLGSSRTPALNKGQVKSKLSFTQADSSIPGTPILRKDLGKGIMGEANNDGSIFISHKLEPGSQEEQHVLMHEMVHQTDMKIGKLAYEDDHIMYDGRRFERMDVDGVDAILVDGKWKEAGDTGFPWENDANNGNGDI